MAHEAHRPRLILILRHGKSEANCDWSINCRVPNQSVKLTKEGHEQAQLAGSEIKDLLRPTDKVSLYQSPYVRTRQTAKEIIDVLQKDGPQQSLEIFEDPRLREQDFGNFQDPDAMRSILSERDEYGYFFYRIPNGESPADVYDRCSSFCDTLHRHFHRYEPDVVILVSHGIWGRVFLMRWFYWPFEKFENLANLPNAKVISMEHIDGVGYKLLSPLVTWTPDKDMESPSIVENDV